jgi:hypothetical protein
VVMSEYLSAIRLQGVDPSETQVRWAMKTGKLPRPQLDGAHRFVFCQDDVDLAVAFFQGRAMVQEVAHD